MRFVRNLVVGLLVIGVALKLTERFVLQPKLNQYVQQYVLTHKNKVTVESILFKGALLTLSGIKIKNSEDPFSVTGSLAAVLLGWPGVKGELYPSGSRIWSIQRIDGQATVGINTISAKRILIQNFRLAKTPQFVIPHTYLSFDYDLTTRLLQLDIEIPQVAQPNAKGESPSQIFISGTLDPKDSYSGKLVARVVNPGAVLEQLAAAELISKHQFSSIKGLVGGLSRNQQEVTLPLSVEKGALYLGPIRLYPKSSKEDNLARIGEGLINNLFRAFAKTSQ
jgi:Uncharacterized protein conserved in bacteria (DUF2125)